MRTIRDTHLPVLLKKLRGDMSLAEFAEKWGVSKALVQQWENGRCRPTPERLEIMGIKVIYSAKIP